MFDLGAAELLVIVVVAIIVIGPKDMPMALRTAGKWIGKVRKVSAHFRSGLDTMVREAELEEMEQKWKAQNDAIMARTDAATNADADQASGSAENAEMTGPPISSDDDPVSDAVTPTQSSDPQLSLGVENNSNGDKG